MLFWDAEGLHLFLGRGEEEQLPWSTLIHLHLSVPVSNCLRRLNLRILHILTVSVYPMKKRVIIYTLHELYIHTYYFIQHSRYVEDLCILYNRVNMLLFSIKIIFITNYIDNKLRKKTTKKNQEESMKYLHDFQFVLVFSTSLFLIFFLLFFLL